MATQKPDLENFLRSDFANSNNKETTNPEQEMVPLDDRVITIEALVSNKDSIENIVATQKQLSQVKESLGTIIDTMAQNPSLFTRASNFYGEMPLWQKVVIGVGLSVPTLAAGIFAHIGILLVISGATAVSYTAAGIILDDHHTCNVNIAERLKAGIFNLADVLQLTIDALDVISKKLALEIEKFKAENLKLAKHVEDLGNQVGSLSSQVEFLMETEKLLRATKDALEETSIQLKDSITQLNDSVSEQSELLAENQVELEKVTKLHEQSQKNLSEKIVELNVVKVEMGLEVEKAQKIALTLQGTVNTLVGTTIADQKQKEQFQKRLDGFLADKEKSFDQVADRIFGAERELASVKEELRVVKDELNRSLESHKELIVEHKSLLEEQRKQLNSMKAAPSKTPLASVNTSQPTKGKENMGNILSSIGHFSHKKHVHGSEINSQDLQSTTGVGKRS